MSGRSRKIPVGRRGSALKPMRALSGLTVIFLAVACDAPPPLRSEEAGAAGGHTPAHVREGQVARFREQLPEVAGLAGGAASQEELIATFLSAAQQGDTATLRRLALDRAEFAWLYYPTASQAQPPYDLDPETLWLVTSQQGERGLSRLLEALRGTGYPYAGHRCKGDGRREGSNRLYGPCLVRLVQAPGDTVEARLFGLVLERGGRWKFVNYSNRLD